MTQSRIDNDNTSILFYFCAFFLLFTLIVSGIFYGILKIDAHMELETLKASELSRMDATAHLVNYENRIASSDILFLAHMPSLTRYADEHDALAKNQFMLTFMNFAKERKMYEHIHYINTDGTELMGLNLGNHVSESRNSMISAMEKRELEEFFEKTITLSNEQVYLSIPMQISRETPLSGSNFIFVGTPVYGKTGKKSGLLVLHMSNSQLLHDFHKTMAGKHHVYLLNGEGDRIDTSEHAAREFNINDATNFKHQFPEAWNTIRNSDRGNVITSRGLFSYVTFNPLYDTDDPSLPRNNKLNRTANFAHKLDTLKIVTFIPSSKLPSASLSRYPLILGIYTASVFLLLILAGYIAIMITNRKKVLQALQRSVLEVQDLYENAPCGYHSINQDGVILRMNRTELTWLGYERDDVIGKMNIIELLTPESRAKFHEIFAKFKQDGVIQDIEYEMRRKNGSSLTVLLNSVAVYDAQGNYIMSRTTVFDNTRRKQMEHALRESEERFRRVMEYAPIGMAIVSIEGKFQQVNRVFCEILGYSQSELEQLSFPDITYADDLPADLEHIKRMLDGNLQFYKTEKRYVRKNGEIMWGQLTASIMRDNITNTPLYFIAQVENIAERKLYHQKIHQLAYHDSLTNLPNRHLLVDRLNQALANAERHRTSFAVLFLDIDGFKQINDTFGHDVGDELLQTISIRLRNTLRANDTAARLSGDEFVIILVDTTNHESITTSAAKILETLGESAYIHGQILSVSVSIGIAIYPRDGTNASQLIKNADIAMYQAKKAGKNQYQFYRTQEMAE